MVSSTAIRSAVEVEAMEAMDAGEPHAYDSAAPFVRDSQLKKGQTALGIA
jgi:hypothetical protein